MVWAAISILGTKYNTLVTMYYVAEIKGERESLEKEMEATTK